MPRASRAVGGPGDLAHELRTPLARIRVALDLAEAGDAAVARESLAEIAEDLAELEGLVNDILTSARMDLANSTLSAAPPLCADALDLATVVQGAAERLRHRHPERAVELDVEAGLPAVRGDTVLLRRALTTSSTTRASTRRRTAPSGSAPGGGPEDIRRIVSRDPPGRR